MTDANPAAQLLVVDDNEMNRDVLSRRLERQGYQVALAEDGEQALEMVRARRFDLVFLDIMMPKMNGYQVLEQMRAEGMTPNTPVIVISALDELDSVVKCIELGAEDYLFKPFNPVLLKARVSAVLEKGKLRAQSAGEGNDQLRTQLAEAVADLQKAVKALTDEIASLTPQQVQQLDSIRATAEVLATALDVPKSATD